MLKEEHITFKLAALPGLLLPGIKNKQNIHLNVRRQILLCILVKINLFKLLRLFKSTVIISRGKKAFK